MCALITPLPHVFVILYVLNECDWKTQQDYRLSVVFLLQHLTVLDQEKVTAEEKVST